MRKLPPLVAVYWHDSVGLQGWHNERDAKQQAPMPIISVGFIIDKTQRKITLAGGMSLINTEVNCMDFMTIPIHNVFKISRFSLKMNNGKKNTRKAT